MPLLDHFRPPISNLYPFDSFNSNWATRIADDLMVNWLPPEFMAAENTYLGARPEIDIATYELTEPRPRRGPPNGPAMATLPSTWTAPAPQATVAMTFPGAFEVVVRRRGAWNTLVAVIELISESNKDRPSERHAFAAKCASYLKDGVSVAVIDVVTSRSANLFNEILRLIAAPTELEMPAEQGLYAASFRPTLREGRPESDIWSKPLAVSNELPTMPLRLTADLFVPVEFETTYVEACRLRRLI